jgi:streptogramin lyase
MQKTVILSVIAFSAFLVCFPQINSYAKEVSYGGTSIDLMPQADKTWVAMDSLQCPEHGLDLMDNWSKMHNNATYPIGQGYDAASIKNFYKNQGFVIFDTRIVSSGTGVCAACGCPTGDTVYLLVSNSDVSKIQKFGYSVILGEIIPSLQAPVNQTGNPTLASHGSVSIVSVQATDEQTNPVLKFAKGTNGFVKVIMSSQSDQMALTTVDLIGSDLTSLGTGSIKSILTQTGSQMTLSFFIPDGTKNGTANICTDVYSDWPDKGGFPLASESCVKVEIEDSIPKNNDTTNGTSNGTGMTQFPSGISAPSISSTKPGIKIISVQMSPDPLTVGDIPRFSATYQNISDKPIYHTIGCGSDLFSTISPDANVAKTAEIYPQCAQSETPIEPNQIITDNGAFLGHYKIIQPGMLNVTLTLGLREGPIFSQPDTIVTIEFYVNATNKIGTITQNPMSVNDVIQNIDSLYNKTISVHGYYSSRYPFVLPACSYYAGPHGTPRYHDSVYISSSSGNHYLSNVTQEFRGDTLEIRIIDPNTNTTFTKPAYDDGKFVTLNGTLLKQYVPARCGGSPDFYDLYKSAYLLVDLNKTFSTKEPANNTAFQFNFPEGVTVDSFGNIYVTEELGGKVDKFDPTGKLLSQFGSGTGLYNPSSSIVDSSGNVYVGEFSKNRIVKFSPTGAVLYQIGPNLYGTPTSATLFVEIGSGQSYSQAKYTSPVVLPNHWSLVAVTYDGSRTADGIKIYVNGTEQTTTSIGSGFTKFANPRDQWTIGSDAVPGGYDTFVGLIDEAEIYNSAVTQQEIQAEFAADSAGKCKPTPSNIAQCITPPLGLVGWWPGDGNANDLISSNFGTISGGVTFAPGKVGQAFSFDGSGLVNVGALGIKNDDKPFSIIAWINPSSSTITDGFPHTIVAESSGLNNIGNGEFFTHLSTVGSTGSILSNLNGAALDSEGNIYILDSGNNKIVKLDSSGRFISQFGSAGTGPGQFNGPHNITVDNLGNIYVIMKDDRIVKFDQTGQFLLQFGSTGTAPGQFEVAEATAVDGSGNIYVSDLKNNRVEKFDPTGRFLLQIGSAGSGPGQFNGPVGIAVDSSGNIYVADWNNGRIEKFSPSGTFLFQIGSSYNFLPASIYSLR